MGNGIIEWLRILVAPQDEPPLHRPRKNAWVKAASMTAAAGALLNVDLERAFEKLSPMAMPRTMRGRGLAV